MAVTEKNILCIDDGMFSDFCLSLTDYFKTVYYYTEWHGMYPTIKDFAPGTEWRNGKMLNEFEGKNFIKVSNMFSILPQVDLVFFPSVTSHNELGVILEKSGIPCFGATKGNVLEIDKVKFLDILKENNMDVAPYTIVNGLDKIRENQVEYWGRYAKIPFFRGDFETFKVDDSDNFDDYYFEMKRKLGKLSNLHTFILQDPIDAIVEEGADCYTILGKYPDYTLEGCEVKDKAYAGMVIPYNSLSNGNKRVLSQLQPILSDYSYKGFFSTEVRTTENKNYLIDFTARLGWPPSSSQSLLFQNIGEIIDEGSQGNLVNPEFEKKYVMEYILKVEDADRPLIYISFDSFYRKNIKIINPVIIDGKHYSINNGTGGFVGSLVAVGNNFSDCIDQIKAILEDGLSIQDLVIDVNVLDKAVQEYYKSHKK